MKKVVKSFLLFFCTNLIVNFNNLICMSKSPIPPRKKADEIWHIKTPSYGSTNNFDGKTGFCMKITKKEIEETGTKLLKLHKTNNNLFNRLYLSNINNYPKYSDNDITALQKLKLLGSNKQIPTIISILLEFLFILTPNGLEPRLLDDLYEQKVLEQICKKD